MDDSGRPSSRHRSRVAFTYRDFRYLELARLFAILGWQMQSVAVGWQVYALTQNPLHLGYIGLVQFAPAVAFLPFTGQTADRFDRRQVVRICQALLVICSVALAALTIHGIGNVAWIFAVLFLIGTAQAFLNPAAASLLPLIVPTTHFANAVAWHSTIWQLATIMGPALGGAIYGLWGAQAVYLSAAMVVTVAFFAVTMLRTRSGRMQAEAVSLRTVLAGIRYIRANRVILGCISLDLFAVLLGGAVALMPVYASDILHVGPTGLGLLRGAPAVGAFATALAFTHLPPMKRAGASMLWAVAGFGLATIIFGLSRNFHLSLVALVTLGGLDMISVIVRQTMIQTLTPRHMLGRVNAVNHVFLGASNELGEFESGVTAAWWGAVPAVVVGGLGTILVVVLWSRLFPKMRAIGRLDELKPIDVEQAEGGPVL